MLGQEKARQSELFCLVAGPGIEPGTRAYETLEMPFLYPAIDFIRC